MFSNVRIVAGTITGRITKRMLGPHVHALVIKTEDGVFAIDPEDRRVGKELRMKGRYGSDEMERLAPYISATGRILIVGAHIGSLAIPMARSCEQVVAIEANPRTFEFLEMNIALNGIGNCRTINVAASDKEENISFLLSRANSGGSKRVPKVKKLMYYSDKPEQISIKAVSLDAILENKSFDVIIMDIEGSEYFALKGMQEILANSKVLAVEYLPHHLRYVSGVTVDRFLSVITPHFPVLTIPSKGITLRQPADALRLLTNMYNHDEGDDGIVFQKG